MHGAFPPSRPPNPWRPNFLVPKRSDPNGFALLGGDHLAGLAIGGSCLAGGLLLQLADLFFHFLARLERDDELLRHVDPLARPRVACFTRCPLFDFKDTEVAEFDAPLLAQRLDDSIERLLDDLFRLQLGEAD